MSEIGEILTSSSIVFSAIIFVSVVFLHCTGLRIANTAPTRIAAAASAIFGVAVFYSSIALIASRLALAAIVTDFAVRVFIRLWASLRPTHSAGGTDDRTVSIKGAVRSRTLAVYIFFLAVVASVEPANTLQQVAQIISVVLAQELGWLTIGVSSVVIGAILLSERKWPNVAHAGLFAVSVFCATLALSLRPAFSALVMLCLIGGVIAASRLQYKYLRVSLHAYDVVYYLSNLATPLFFFRNVSTVSIPSLGVIAGALILLSFVWMIEPALFDRSHALAAFLIASGAFVISKAFVAPRDNMRHFDDFAHITTFLGSAVEAVHACRHGAVFATHPPDRTTPALSSEPALRYSRRRRPQIVVILNESTFPPSIYAQPDPSINDFFQSIDGRTRQLRVETYGGMTWITEFSLLTGIPASSYGVFRPHVFRWATGRYRHSLPYCLKQNGYRIATIYPLSQNFVGTGAFYRSIGFDEIIDRSMLGTNRDIESDFFYHDHALDWLEKHFSASEEPAFVFMLTMSNHSPHNGRLTEPSSALASPKTTTLSEMDEYMRRLRLSRDDYARFRTELTRRFPEREFLLVHFGDHQPSFTSQMLGRKQNWRGTPEQFPTEEIAYRTYFAIDGVNFQPRVDADVPDVLEIAYLGTVILAAAGLTLDSVHMVRRQLMTRHLGRLFFADHDGKIAKQLNRRLIDAGLISPH